MRSLEFRPKTIAAGVVLFLLSVSGSDIRARQEPQPQPVPTPPLAFDLNGKWVTNTGEAVLVRQDGSTVSAKFETPQPCPSNPQRARANLLVGARYSGSQLSGTSDYIACAFATGPFLTVCELPAVYATKFNATVSEDGATITGQWFADGNWVTLSGGQPVACEPDSRYEKWTTFTLTRCGDVDLKLTSDDDFRINTDPKMPDLQGESAPPQGKVQWEAQIKFKSAGSCSGGPDFDSSTMNERIETFEPVFSATYGGTLTMKVTTACGSVTKTEEIKGTNPTRAEINAEIGTVGAPFEADDLKRIACHESPVGQFDGSGNPVIAGGGDVGIMQICYRRQTRDIWDWKYNVQRGRENLQEQVRFAGQMPRFVREGKRDNDTGLIVYPRNALSGYREATEFTHEQLRMEAIKRYNAGTELNVGYWEWNPAANVWGPNPLGGGGGPGYADEVIVESTACGS